MIDEKIKLLRTITTNFLFIEYYSHQDCEMWKILNEFTNFNTEKIVLCPLEEGIEKALDLAITHLSEIKITFEK